MNIGVGDVVLVDSLKQQFVVLFVRNNEDMSSMCEDKVYYVAPMPDIDGAHDLMYDLVNSIQVKIQGRCPSHTLTLVEDEAPFVINKVDAVRIVRRKVAKTIKVYE